MTDLNTATIEALAALPGVTVASAYDLALWRPYATWADVACVPGFDHERVRQLRDCGASLGNAPVADCGQPDARFRFTVDG